MNKQIQQQTYLNQNRIEPLVFTPLPERHGHKSVVTGFTPLARSPGSRVEAFPESKALQFDGHPRLVPIINNQRVNRVLSRFPVNIPTRFAPSLPKGEKTFEPSTKMRERLQSLRRNLTQVYLPEQEIKIKGEIPFIESAPGGPSIPSLPRDEVLRGEPSILDEVQQLRQQLVRKEQELAKEKSKEKALSEMVGTYQAQIESLTQKTKELTAEIEQTEGELPHLRKQTKLLREKVSQEKPSYQQKEKDVVEFKNSLFRSKQVIAELQEKISQKEKYLQKILVESQVERERAGKAVSEKEAVEALVKNLRAALKNAKEEQERAKGQALSPQQLQVKEEQIEKLSRRLEQKEKEAQIAREMAEKAKGVLAREEDIRAEIANYQNQIAKLQTQNQELSGNLQNEEKKLEKLRATVGRLAAENKQKEEKLVRQDKHLSNLRLQKEKLAAFADELSEKLSSVRSEKHLQTIVEAELGKKAIKKPVTKVVPRKAEETLIKPLTSLPNALNGIIMTVNEKLIKDAVVIIKDKNNNPLRALRTNELGQFLVATPLPNGTYHLEIEKEGEEFDILEVELTGDVLSPIEIRAK